MEAEGLQGELVYDHKMLWRANLYIDEGQAEDWNNTHPWADSDNNEWFVPQANGADKDGGQIEINSSTWRNENTPVDDKIAYSVGTHDSPSEFNDKMIEQMNCINHSISNGLNGYEESESLWNRTIAPSQKELKFDTGSLDWSNYISTPIDGVQSYPYRPIALSWIDKTPTNAAGADCVGLVQRSGSYSGESYQFNPVSPYTWTTTKNNAINNRRFFITSTSMGENGYGTAFTNDDILLYEITKSADVEIKNGLSIYNNLDKIIPGDIVYYNDDTTDADDNGNYHILLVQSIDYSNGRNIGLDDILLFEATWPGSKIGRTIAHLQDIDEKTWIVGRLK